jgi:hypothetical protein
VSSTKRRRALANKINSFSTEIPFAYSEYRKYSRSYLVYTSSSRYNYYNRYNSSYDVRVIKAK